MSAYPSGNKSNHHMTNTRRPTDSLSGSNRKRTYSAIEKSNGDCDDENAVKRRNVEENPRSYLGRIFTWFKETSFVKMLSCTSQRMIFEEGSDVDRQGLMHRGGNHTKDDEVRSRWKTKGIPISDISPVPRRPADAFITIGRRVGERSVSGSSLDYDKGSSQYSSRFLPKMEQKPTRVQLSRPHIHPPNTLSKLNISDDDDDDVQEDVASSSKNAIDIEDDDEPQVIGEYRNTSQSVDPISRDQSLGLFPLHPQYMRDSKTKQLRSLSKYRSLSGPFFRYGENSFNGANNWFKGQTFFQKELINLEERMNYKLLLNQCKYTSYGALSKRKPIVETQDRAVETAFEGNKENCDMGVKYGAFTKEKIGYLKLPDHALMKPCKLVPQSEFLKETEKPEVITVEEEEDEKILKQILTRTKSRPLPKGRFYSPEYLSSLTSLLKDETSERLKIEEEANRLKEEIAQLRAKRELLDKSENMEEILPEITPEMNAIIDSAFKDSNSKVVLSKLNSVQVMGKDLDTLQSLNWLNDEVVNFYLELIVERSKQPGYPSLYSFNTFFFPTLKKKGYSNVKRWTRKVDIFSYDIILVPLHLGIHWCLAVIDFRSKKIQFYDSMHGKETSWLVLKNYLIDEMKDKKKQDFDMSSWVLEALKDIPPQLNGSDCGMFTLKYAEYVSRDAPISFTQEHMPYFRRRMVYEILTKTIL